MDISEKKNLSDYSSQCGAAVEDAENRYICKIIYLKIWY